MGGIIEYLDSITIIAGAITLGYGIFKGIIGYRNRYDGITYTKYCKDLSSDDFFYWRQSVIKSFYPNETFVSLFGVEYPAKLYKSSNEEYPFTKLSTASLTSKAIPESKANRLQKVFLKKLASVVHRPQNIGYALEELIFDENQKLISFTSFPCTFEQTLISSFYLEYEIYKDYLKKNRKKNISERLPQRAKYHHGNTIEDVFTKSLGKNSMMSVQSLVVFKDHITNEYKTIFSKRSNKVSYSPNTWQLIPCGYFETFESSNSQFTIENNFNPTLAILRELLEELFNMEEFIENQKGAPIERILSHDVSVYLTDLVKSNKAKFIFLGTVLDVVTLTHKLSYLLIIDDLEFSKQNFTPNFESKDMQLVSIDKIHTILENIKLMPESAGLLKLAFDNENLQKIQKLTLGMTS